MLDTPAHAFAPPQPGYPELASERLARMIIHVEANVAIRKAQTKRDRLFIIMAAVVVGLFGFGAAAVADRGMQNWENTRVANVQQ